MEGHLGEQRQGHLETPKQQASEAEPLRAALWEAAPMARAGSGPGVRL